MEDGFLRIDQKTRRPKRINDIDLAGSEFQHDGLLMELWNMFVTFPEISPRAGESVLPDPQG